MKQNDITDYDVAKLTAQNIENLFNIYQDSDGNYFYNILRTVDFPEDLDPSIYGTYVTQPGDTWPLIAWKFYKDVKLWWLICALNNVINPVAQPVSGTSLKILENSFVRQILSQIKGS